QNEIAIVPAIGATCEKGVDLCSRACRTVWRTGPPGRWIARDAPAPRIGRLRTRAGQRIRQAVARRNIHHQEWIECNLDAARFEFGDQVAHALIGRRTAESGAPIDPRYDMCA